MNNLESLDQNTLKAVFEKLSTLYWGELNNWRIIKKLFDKNGEFDIKSNSAKFIYEKIINDAFESNCNIEIIIKKNKKKKKKNKLK